MRSALVIGAGPAGSSAALVLARAGIEVTVVAMDGCPPFAIGEALPPAARPVLASLGLEARVEAQGHRRAVGNRSAWGSARISTTDFIGHPFGHGFHLDRRVFDAGLLAAARDAGARVLHGRLRGAAGGAGAWRLHVETGAGPAILAGEVVVDCSGRRAAFARRQGASRVQTDRLVAVAARLEAAAPESDADATTLVEAVADGWWYTARLPGAARIVAFLTDSDLPAARDARSPDRFRARLAATTHVDAACAAGGYAVASLPRAFAADTGRIDTVLGEGWLAAGDAAASFDPISSQGIMTAMQCGQRAAAAVLDGAVAEYALAVDALIARYEIARAAVYAQERRWADAPFWRRRHAPPARRSGVLPDQEHRAGLAG